MKKSDNRKKMKKMKKVKKMKKRKKRKKRSNNKKEICWRNFKNPQRV